MARGSQVTCSVIRLMYLSQCQLHDRNVGKKRCGHYLSQIDKGGTGIKSAMTWLIVQRAKVASDATRLLCKTTAQRDSELMARKFSASTGKCLSVTMQTKAGIEHYRDQIRNSCGAGVW